MSKAAKFMGISEADLAEKADPIQIIKWMIDDYNKNTGTRYKYYVSGNTISVVNTDGGNKFEIEVKGK